MSKDPNDRAIGGASSGAICAFTAAWERPDAFRRVLSTIGTYVGLRGGNEYPTLIRKSEPKPIRVFLQDGSNDLDIYGGGWWTANQSMLAALKWADYDVHHTWGEGGHNGKHAAAIMPEAMRWLWRNYPEPIKARYGTKRRTDVLIEGQDWQQVKGPSQWGTFGTARGLTSDKDGNVYISDMEHGTVYRIDTDGKRTVFADGLKNALGMEFDRDGNLIVCQGTKVTRIAPDGTKSVLDGFQGDDVVTIDGGGFLIDRGNNRLWRFNDEGIVQPHNDRFDMPAGITATPDDAFLIAASYRDRFHVSFEIVPGEHPDLRNRQEYGYIHTPPRSRYSTGGGMTVATDGRVYMATQLGVQIFDQLGRVHLILNSPAHGEVLSDVCFGGTDRDTLFVATDQKVFSRRLKTKGVGPHEKIKPPKPGL